MEGEGGALGDVLELARDEDNEGGARGEGELRLAKDEEAAPDCCCCVCALGGKPERA